MNKNLNPFKPAPNDDKEFTDFLEQQQSFINCELLTLALMQAYNRDIRNLEVFISPNVRKELNFIDDNMYDPEIIWEFCGEIASYVEEGGPYPGKKQYLGFIPTGIFSSLGFVAKKNKASVLEVTTWASQINFTAI